MGAAGKVSACLAECNGSLPPGLWRGGLVVGRRTCNLRVAGLRPGRDAAVQQP